MAGRVDILHPAENANLGRDLTTKGLQISEHPINIAPKAHHFRSRKRLISGICSVVIIVDATAKSDRLIIARDALDQGRSVLVITGYPFDARAAGCNMLIRDGAVLVSNTDDFVLVLKA